MKQVDPHSAALTGSPRGLRGGLRTASLAAAITAGVLFGVPAIPAGADPAPPPPPTVEAPPPADPNAPLAAEPELPAPELDRVDDTADGFSYVLPAGWVQSDASHLEYGSALLSKQTGEPVLPGQQPPVANDTRIILGRLDQRLYASAETDHGKAATRLGSDMGEFFMPYPGTRINQETAALAGSGVTGSASYYEVKFTDTAKPVGQIWTGVVATPAAEDAPSQRWFVVWLGTANNPVDRGAAKALAESLRPLVPPPAPDAAPVPAPDAAPAPGVPAPAPAPAPAPGAAPAPAPVPPAPAPAAPAASPDGAPVPAAPAAPPAPPAPQTA